MSNKLIQSMLEPLASRFQSIEDRLSNLENKKECRKEITDTERLDFFEKYLGDGGGGISCNLQREAKINFYRFSSKCDDLNFDVYSKTIRGAVDGAMRGKNGG